MRRSARRTVAKSAPPTTINTPTPSTLVPTMSIICRKFSMAVFIAGKRADFQCSSWQLQPTRLPPQKQLALENDAGDRVMLGMAERDQSRSYAAFPGELLRGPRKDKKRFAALFFSNVDVAPAHCP